MGLKGRKGDTDSDLAVRDPELSDDAHSYILITCAEPIKGEMQVAMTYQGDPTLISCLLHDAQNYIDHQDDNS